MTREILTRLRTSERLRTHVALLSRHHLRLGFLVHHRPVSERRVYDYLVKTDPVSLDVTLLSVADRLATTRRSSVDATQIHLDLARQMLPAVRAWQEGDRQPALVRGDELAQALGLAPGPVLGELLDEVAAAHYAQEIGTRDAGHRPRARLARRPRAQRAIA